MLEDVDSAVNQLAQTTLRDVVGQHSLDEVLSHPAVIDGSIRQILDTATREWGVEVALVELSDIRFPDSMMRATAREADAEAARVKLARVIAAEGEAGATAAPGIASDPRITHPPALRRRHVQTLAELGVEKETTVVVPAPSMSALGELGSFPARESAAAASRACRFEFAPTRSRRTG